MKKVICVWYLLLSISFASLVFTPTANCTPVVVWHSNQFFAIGINKLAVDYRLYNVRFWFDSFYDIWGDPTFANFIEPIFWGDKQKSTTVMQAIADVLNSNLVEASGGYQAPEIAGWNGTGISNGFTIPYGFVDGDLYGVLDINHSIYRRYYIANIGNIGSWSLDNSSMWAVISPVLPPIPEPSSLLLFGTGLAGLTAVGRRRK